MFTHRTFKIGRDPANDFVLSHRSISRFHLEVFINEEGIVFITDLKSSNGTFINGNRVIGSTILKPGDILKLGAERPIRWQNWSKELYENESEVLSNQENSILDYTYPPEPSFFQRHMQFIFGVILIIVILFILMLSYQKKSSIKAVNNLQVVKTYIY